MAPPRFHRFEQDGRRYVIDPDTCFCFECDEISWDVLDQYPGEPVNRILHTLEGRHDRRELEEVIGELEWLRATKAVLPRFKPEEVEKRYSVKRGIQRMTVAVPDRAPAALLQKALLLLLSRAGEQTQLQLDVRASMAAWGGGTLGAACNEALAAAARAGKTLTLRVRCEDFEMSRPGEGLVNVRVVPALETASAKAEWPQVIRGIRWQNIDKPDKLYKAMNGWDEFAPVLHLTADSEPLSGALSALVAAGFRHLELDTVEAFLRPNPVRTDRVFATLSESARYYAQRLLDGNYFRLEPIASYFLRIYEGSPVFRTDPIGTNELAVDADGAVYPTRYWLGTLPLSVGHIDNPGLNESRLREFENVGALTTPSCMRCWARGLCGGGVAAVHQALTGNWRTPDPEWSEAQRRFSEDAVAAFNLLSSQGVPFTRLYGSLAKPAKASLFQLAKAAFRMHIAIRPIAEADAEWLQRWENWNDAAYFTLTESGALLATRYDREMDSLHPRALEQEFALLRKNGEPLGLLRVRPERWAGTAVASLYMRAEGDYLSDQVRKSLKFILSEAASQQGLRRLRVPAGSGEDGLVKCLESIGFKEAGTQREALYLHGAYHDVRWYVAAL